MQYYLLILLAVILLALQFSTNKLYQLRCGNTAAASLTFSTLSGLTTSVIFFVLTFAMGETFTITPYSLLMAAIIAGLCCTYTFIGFKIMSFGSMSVFMMFLMLGGMLLPYLFGVFCLDEGISAGRILGVILLVVSMVFPVLSKERSGGVIFVLLCAAVFTLNGCVSITSKLHQINTEFAACGTTTFVFLTNFMSCLISGAGLLIMHLSGGKKDGENKTAAVGKVIRKNAKTIVLIVIGNAAFGGVSYMLQLIGAANVPASVLYPLVTGGSVVLSAAAGLLFFKEKPDKVSAIGLLLSFAATFLFLF
ncbi:MAG: EamA family transporter [Clostridia bacterium]|nr:EamA family transporter [Clostridia bacterium]